LQVLGLSWAFLRSKLVALIGEQKVAWAEKTVDVVKKFITGGVTALWDWIKDQAASIKDAFIESTKGWLLTTLVTKFAEWIVSLLVPGGAILRLIQGIYNLVMWFVNNIQKIIRWVNAVMDSLGNIALGAIAAAVGFIVSAIKTIIPVILDFFARLFNISGIVESVKNIIAKIAAPIHAAINKVIDWIVGWVKKLFGKGDGKAAKKPLEDDKRTPEQKQKDLDKGIAEATTYLQSNGKKNRKDVDEHLEKYRKENGLVELKLVVDKHEESGKEMVHVEGEVNPKKKGKDVEVEVENGGSKIAKYSIDPPFNIYANNPKEFKRQLDAQQEGINKMKVGRWKENRDTFKKNGRGKDDLQDLRDRIKADLAKAYINKNALIFANSKLKDDEIDKKAQEYANSILTRNHAILHEPDQVAGGEPMLGKLYKDGDITDETSLKASKLVGILGVNSSIGSQWAKQGRIEELDKHVDKELSKLTDEEKKAKEMDVKLSRI
jgi:hypothetical protein